VSLGDGRALSASYDKTLRLWDLATGATLRVLEGHSNWVTHVVSLGDGRALSASYDKTLRPWDLQIGDAISMIFLDQVPTAVALDEELGRGIGGAANGRVMFFEIGTRGSPNSPNHFEKFLNY
jgi:WD40 repeat protein